MNRQSLSRTPAVREKSGLTQSGLLQRKCSCGNHMTAENEGTAWLAAAGAAFRSYFGEDFSQVRTHTESGATKSEHGSQHIAYAARGTVAAGDDFAARAEALAADVAGHRDAQRPKGKRPAPQTKKPAPKKAQGTKPDYRSRVKNVNVKTGSRPKVTITHDAKLIKLTLDSDVEAAGEAEVEGAARCRDFDFGFIQLCRPLDIQRIVYGLTGHPGVFIQGDSSAELIAGAPVLDVFHKGDVFYEHAKPACGKGGKTHKVRVDHSDTPSTAFVMPVKGTYVEGIAWQEYFFTTFSVRYPDGSVEHLKSFYWDIHFCQQSDPPTTGFPDGKLKTRTQEVKIGGVINGAPPEPGIALMGKPATKICNDLVKGAKNKLEPAKKSISC